MIRFRKDFGDCAKMVCLWIGCWGERDESKFESLKLDGMVAPFPRMEKTGEKQFVVEEASGEDKEYDF